MPSVWQSYKFDRDDLYRLKLNLRPIAKAYNLRNTTLHGSLLYNFRHERFEYVNEEEKKLNKFKLELFWITKKNYI